MESATQANASGARKAMASSKFRRTIQSARNSCAASATFGMDADDRLGGSGVGALVGGAPNDPVTVSGRSLKPTLPNRFDHQLTNPFHSRLCRSALSPARTSELEEVRWPLNSDCGVLLAR